MTWFGRWTLVLGAFGVLVFAEAQADSSALRRHALLIGTNDGGEGRVRLRYAVSDARSFGRVLEELGGVSTADTVFLEEASRADVVRGLEELKRRIDATKRSGQRVEAIVYYSGHSDEEGLLLRGDRLPYSELRAGLDALAADVRIAILDSCSSGAVARRKGGVQRPAFLMDASNAVKGQAFLTSSSSDEASQESDRIGGSYFTHHLVSGLRGAADSSRDGRVTLTEAYKFAFDETLARTQTSRAGAQHPSWDLDLVGAGDVVLTDLRSTSAGIVFGGELEGRIFVRDERERLVAEIRKVKGESAELAVAPGRYVVLQERDRSRAQAEVQVAAGGRAQLAAMHFRSLPAEITVSRGEDAPPSDEGSERHRFINVSFVPWVASNDVLGGEVTNNVSFGLVAARSAGVDGLAFSTVGNWIDRDMKGVQLAGFGNFVGGHARTLAISGATNVSGGDLIGAQLAGGLNVSSGRATGAQLAGGVNVANALFGLQAAGGVNIAGTIRGAQLSVVNVGGDVTGVQLGVVNVASSVRGLQLGVLNLSGEVSGASVGILSFVRDGQFHVEAWSSDVAYAQVGIKLGSRYVYTLVHAGATPRAPTGEAFLFGAALGVHLPFDASRPDGWFVDVDLGGTSFLRDSWRISDTSLFQLRGMLGIPITGRLSVIVGPSFNMAADFGAEARGSSEESAIGWVRLPGWTSGLMRFWPGVQAGLRY